MEQTKQLARHRREKLSCSLCGAFRMRAPRTIKRARLKNGYNLCPNCAQQNANRPRGAADPRFKGTANIPTHYFCMWRNAANRRTLPFDISIDDVQRQYEKQQGRCALTGRELTTKSNSANRMSLDRIDNERGYCPDNIQLTTTCANLAKHKLTVDAFVVLASDVVKAHSLPLSQLWQE